MSFFGLRFRCRGRSALSHKSEHGVVVLSRRIIFGIRNSVNFRVLDSGAGSQVIRFVSGYPAYLQECRCNYGAGDLSYEDSGRQEFLQRLLTNPSERREVDCKSSFGFEGSDRFSLKLVRHIQGMANGGGGWLVIGFEESDDRGLVPDPQHTEEMCASYDPTIVSQKVDSSVERGQRLVLTVHFERHPVTGLLHPIIQVEGFERLPFVCRTRRAASDSGEEILRQGAIYVRRPGAETAPVSTLQDWEDLIDRCVRLHRDG